MDKHDKDYDREDESKASLQLTYKGLTEFPDFLLSEDAYATLNVVYLGRNLISKLPENLSNLSALTGLYINHNKIQCLPEAIGCLKNLEVLNATGNELLELPKSLGKLVKLKKLLICNNKLSKLPHNIGNLSELLTLEAANNYLTSIPIELAQCANLMTMNFDNNRLTFLPRQLKKLKCLCELSAVENNLYVLAQDIDLHTMYVDKNERLYTIPSSVLTKEVGFYGCGCVPVPQEILDHFLHINIQHTLTEKLPIVLPPELQKVCNMKNCIPTLLELAMRVTYNELNLEDIKDNIPASLSTLLLCPTSGCEMCRQTIFVSGFPIVFKEYIKSAYVLGMCCSLKCVKRCYRINNTALPIVYPSSEDMSVALVLVH